MLKFRVAIPVRGLFRKFRTFPSVHGRFIPHHPARDKTTFGRSRTSAAASNLHHNSSGERFSHLGVHIIIRIFEKLEDLLHGMSLPRWNSAAKAAHQSASLYAVGESGKTPDRWTPFVDVTQTCCQHSLRVRFLIALLLKRFVMLHTSWPIRFLPQSVADSERSTA